MAETLDAMKYHDAGAFVSDVRLIFDNARKYNPPKHPIHVAASKLAKVRSLIGWLFVSSSGMLQGVSNDYCHFVVLLL